MNKRILFLIVIILTINIVGCAKQPEQHEHTWSEWTILTEATIDSEGEKQRTCTECGEQEIEAIPKIESEQIEITVDNFQEYFEFTNTIIVELNGFGEEDANSIWLLSGWRLKKTYQDRLVKTVDGVARINYAKIKPAIIEIDGNNKRQYKIIGTGKAFAYYGGETREERLAAYSDAESNLLGFFVRSYITPEFEYNVELYSQEQMTIERIKCTLILYK